MSINQVSVGCELLLWGAYLCTSVCAQTQITGDYRGKFVRDNVTTLKATGKVVEEGNCSFRMMLSARHRSDRIEGLAIEVQGVRDDHGGVLVRGMAGGYHWRGQIKDKRELQKVPFDLRNIE